MTPSVFKCSLFLLLLNFSLFAQKEKIGKVSPSDLLQRVYEPDSTAEAVVLYDYGYTYFTYSENSGVNIHTDHHTRIRILSENATSQGVLDVLYSQPDHGKEEAVESFKGGTYWLENGQMKYAEVTSKDIFDTKLQNSVRRKKIAFPNVTRDCIIEYSYTLSTPMQISDRPRSWYFQTPYPVIYSEYNIEFPNFLEYNMLMSGYLPVSEKNNERRHIDVGHSELNGMGSYYQYILKNIPAFKDEPYTSSRDNFISKINFELVRSRLGGSLRDYSTTWKAMNSFLVSSEYFGKVILRKTGFLKGQVSLFDGIKDPKERLRAAYKAWNGSFAINDEQWNIFLQNEQKKVLENKRGTPNQVNALFISLLRELDFDASPVILSRRSNGTINRAWPTLDSFDYIITKVSLDGETYLLDITDKSLSMGVLPFECLNFYGFEVKPGGGEFIEIAPKSKYWETMSFVSEMDLENKQVKGTAERSYLGYSGAEVRRAYYTGSQDFEPEFKKNLGPYAIDHLEMKNLEDNNMPLVVKYTYGYGEEDWEDEPELIYFNPMLNEQFKKNPFTLEERLYPVDFGWGYDEIFSHKIRIPKGYTVESAPESAAFSLPDQSARYSYQFLVNQDEVSVLTRFSIKNPVYYAESYQDLKELFSYMVRKGNEQIVFKKK